MAADLLARGGEPPSMADIARPPAWPGRPYRYFPTRERLLAGPDHRRPRRRRHPAGQADLDAVPVPEAIARIARVVAAAGSKYAAVAARPIPPAPCEQQIGTMIQAVLQRGIDDGTFRGDLTVNELGFVLG